MSVLMDYPLEKEITLLDETQHDGYYPWCLRETTPEQSKEEESCYEDYVPWPYSLYFNVCEMRLSRGIGFGDLRFHLNDEEFQIREEAEEINIKDNEAIFATISSGYINENKNIENITRFSMLGTDRTIDNFTLRIFCVDERDRERCFISGCISYKTDWDYIEKTEPDSIEIVLGLSKSRFNHLASLISNRSIDTANLVLGGIDGVYSIPSPLTTTDFVKILTSDRDQKIHKPEACEIIPPNLNKGAIDHFNLSLTTLYKYNPKQNASTLYVKNLFDSHTEQKADLAKFMVNQIISTSKINNSLRLISVLLGLLLLSIWLK